MDTDTIRRGALSPATGTRAAARGVGRGVRRRCAGLTFAELMLAIVITSLVAMGVASMMLAVTYGTTTHTGLRDNMVRLKMMTGRIDAALRNARMVLASGSNYIVLWNDDTHANGVPDLSEITYIERNSATNTVTCYKVAIASGTTQATINASDVTFTFADNFATQMTTNKNNGKLTGTLWGTGVTALTFTPNNATVQSSTFVSYRMTIPNGGTQTTTEIGAMSLRTQ